MRAPHLWSAQAETTPSSTSSDPGAGHLDNRSAQDHVALHFLLSFNKPDDRVVRGISWPDNDSFRFNLGGVDWYLVYRRGDADRHVVRQGCIETDAAALGERHHFRCA